MTARLALRLWRDVRERRGFLIWRERWTGLVVSLLLYSKLASREWMFCGGAVETESQKQTRRTARPTQDSARAQASCKKDAEPSPDRYSCEEKFAHVRSHCIALPLVRRDAAARDAARRRRPHGPRVSRRPVAPYLLLPGRRNAFSGLKSDASRPARLRAGWSPGADGSFFL